MNSPDIHVRPAELQDGPGLLTLIDALADYEKLRRPDAEARQRLLQDAFGDRRRIDVYLALISQQAVGYAIVLETYSSFLALPTLYLEDIFVLPDFRSQGAGYKLFACCAAEALKRGCGRMEWMVLDWNRLAQGFYERLGATRLSEWLPYRMLRPDLERMLHGHADRR